MLYIIATPIGNLEDITLRALNVLKSVDSILAEDTRKTAILLNHFSIKKPLHSFYDHNEAQRVPQIVEDLKQNQNIALVSSAGVPTISDPGYKLIRECRKNNLPITALPGPSSVINALTLSSIPHNKFLFLGYLSRKSNEQKKIISQLIEWGGAIVFFESPYRIVKTLENLKEILGERQLTITREMTKKFEEVLELTATCAINHFEKTKPLGEFTIVVDASNS